MSFVFVYLYSHTQHSDITHFPRIIIYCHLNNIIIQSKGRLVQSSNIIIYNYYRQITTCTSQNTYIVKRPASWSGVLVTMDTGGSGCLLHHLAQLSIEQVEHTTCYRGRELISGWDSTIHSIIIIEGWQIETCVDEKDVASTETLWPCLRLTQQAPHCIGRVGGIHHNPSLTHH